MYGADFKEDEYTYQEYSIAHASASSKASFHDQICSSSLQLLTMVM